MQHSDYKRFVKVRLLETKDSYDSLKIGLINESYELFSEYTKYTYDNKNILLEIGDIYWYITAIMQSEFEMLDSFDFDYIELSETINELYATMTPQMLSTTHLFYFISGFILFAEEFRTVNNVAVELLENGNELTEELDANVQNAINGLVFYLKASIDLLSSIVTLEHSTFEEMVQLNIEKLTERYNKETIIKGTE